MVEDRQAFSQPGVKADVLNGRQPPSSGPPAGGFNLPAHGPRLMPCFPLLSEPDLPPYRSQQKLLQGNLRVLVDVLAHALGQPVEWGHGVRSGRRNMVSLHMLSPAVRQGCS